MNHATDTLLYEKVKHSNLKDTKNVNGWGLTEGDDNS